MADLGIDVNKLPTETRTKLAELELELSEGKSVTMSVCFFFTTFHSSKS